MATYFAKADNFADWKSTGWKFASVGGGAGLVGLLCWAATNGHLERYGATDPNTQLFLMAFCWIASGLFAIMAIAAWGSILISNRDRGSITTTGEGVERRIGKTSRVMRWEQIEGFVEMTDGQVVLLSKKGQRQMSIPLRVDGYWSFLDELKAKGLQSLPERRVRKGLSWKQYLNLFLWLLCFNFARDDREPHPVRVGAFVLFMLMSVWLAANDDDLRQTRWFGFVFFIGLIVWVLLTMAHTW